MDFASWSATEFHGRGDPMFGGSADDRSLGQSGLFLTGSYHVSEVARFPTPEAAQAAADAAPNRRPAALLSILGNRDEKPNMPLAIAGTRPHA